MQPPPCSRTKRHLATASDDGTTKVLDALGGQKLLTLRSHSGPVSAVRYSHDGKRLVTAIRDETVRVRDALSGHELLTLRGNSGSTTPITFEMYG